MARWEGEAPVDDESEGGGGGNFEPAPRGFYKIQVADYKEDTTFESKRPCLKLTCEIAEGEYLGKKVWLTVTKLNKGDKGYGFFVRNLHAFGFGLDGTYNFEPEDWQGAQAYALLGVKPHTKLVNGQSYTNQVNYIEALYTPNHPQPDELPPAPVNKATQSSAITAPAQRPQEAGELEEVPF